MTKQIGKIMPDQLIPSSKKMTNLGCDKYHRRSNERVGSIKDQKKSPPHKYYDNRRSNQETKIRRLAI